MKKQRDQATIEEVYSDEEFERIDTEPIDTAEGEITKSKNGKLSAKKNV